MLSGIPESAICVQRFDDSLNSAIHITYRISLRSSSLREPRDPLSKVVSLFNKRISSLNYNNSGLIKNGGELAKETLQKEKCQSYEVPKYLTHQVRFYQVHTNVLGIKTH